LDLVQVLQVVELAQTTAGQAGLVLAVQVDKECTASQAAVAEVAEQVAVDHQAVEQVALKQQIIQAEQVWTEQVQVVVETTTQAESVRKVVQASLLFNGTSRHNYEKICIN
jgi:hypothetical protein